MNELKCQDCKPPERYPGCHATCKYYQEWKEKKEEQNKAVNKKKYLHQIGKK